MPASAKVNSQVVLYVSPRGRDANGGTRAAPLATVARALRLARRLKGKGEQQRPVRIVLAGGRYELRRPMVIGPGDSGVMRGPNGYENAGNHVHGRYVTLEAAPGSRPVLCGGRVLKGFRPVTLPNGVRAWALHIPSVKRGKWSFRQLWVNGERRFRPTLPRKPRSPGHQFRIEALPDTDMSKPPWQAPSLKFQYASGDIAATLRNISDVEFVAMHFWIATRRKLAHIDAAKRIVTLDAPTRLRLTDDYNTLGAPYYLENVFEALEEPGQWYLDRPAGTLYYIPMKGETPGNVEVIAPVLGELLRIEGEHEDIPKDDPRNARNQERPLAAGTPVDSVKCIGLTFAHTQWQAEEAEQRATPQSAVHVPGAVNLTHARDCHFIDCTIEHAGTYGVELNAGCMDVSFSHCAVRDLGAGGIKVWHTCQRIDIADCRIYDGGHLFHTGCGVLIGRASGCRVIHNHIHDFDYTGISVGWTWGYAQADCFGNIIEFNHVHDIGRGMLSDMGGIYTLGNQVGTRIGGNCFHDIQARGYGGWGIYTDEGSTHILIENNLTYRTKHPGFHQHYGRQNLVRNNIFALAAEAHLARSVIEPHDSFTMVNNIFYNATEKVLAGKWESIGAVMDGNLYWNPAKGHALDFAGKSFRGWQRMGADRRGGVADPLFRNPQKGDYRLKPGSPALRRGFVPLDLSAIGPRAGGRRAAKTRLD
ncbi:MAG: right-handed parallel beta-helix repeat-containing protein [Phycisphaeraceae bacterium]